MTLIMYFYIRVYRGMHKRVNTEMNYTKQIRKRRENQVVAKNTLMLTVVLLVCYVPSPTVLFFGMAVPFLRTSSFFSLVRAADSAKLSCESISPLFRIQQSIEGGDSGDA